MKLSFKYTHNPIFQARIIQSTIFKTIFKDSTNSLLYQSFNNIRYIIFIISHHIINKFTVSKSSIKENDSILSINNNGSFNKIILCFNIKHVH